MTASYKPIKNIAPILQQTQDSQTILVESEGLLNVFTTSFNNNYNKPAFEVLLDQWQTQDLSSFATCEILSNTVLSSANATSKNQNYLSDRFLATAKSKSLVSEVATNNSEATAASQVNFSVLFNDPSQTYSSYYNPIITNVIAAGEKWVNALIAPVSTTLTVEINFLDIPTANASSLTSSYIGSFNSFNTYEQGAAHKIRTGEDTNGALSDIEINFGSSYLTNELWFDPNPATSNNPIPVTKTDAYSVLLHEFGHVFAFNGWRNGADGTLPGDYQSTFDQNVITDDGNLYFIGENAESVYGGPVPLTYGNYGHVGNNSPLPGSNLIPDLMNGIVFQRGQRYDISLLDLAIFSDVGLPAKTSSVQGIIAFSQSQFSINENGVAVQPVTLTRTGGSSDAISVTVNLTNGTAKTASDFISNPIIINFADGETSKTVTIPIVNDNVYEPNETVNLTLSNLTGGALLGSKNTAVLTIIDNESKPIISLSANQTIVEGLTSTQNISYTVSLSNSSSQTITVNYATANGTATAGSDYSAKTGTLTFNPGITSKVVNIPILNDNLNEPNETFTLKLTNPTNATLAATATATTTITDTLLANVTTTLPSNVENLTLTGTTTINGTGNTRNNLITGNSANNILKGALGKDTITGGAGNDRFGYTTLTDSLLSNYDVITDYNNGDQIDAPTGVIAATLTNSVGTATSLNALSTVLTNTVFTANIAKAFKVTGLSGTFIALNNASAGFNAGTDSIIFLQNYTGSVSII